MIWEASCHPQLLKIQRRRKDKSQTSSRRVLNTSPAPAILHICQASRRVALGHYSLIEGGRVQHPMYYNQFRDVILVENVRCLEILLRKPLSGKSTADKERYQAQFGYIAVVTRRPFGLKPGSLDHVERRAYGEHSKLASHLFSNNPGFTANQHITLVNPCFAAEESPIEINFQVIFTPSDLAGPVESQMFCGRLLSHVGVTYYRGYWDILLFMARRMGEKAAKAAAEHLKSRHMTLSCCSLEGLEADMSL